MSRRHPAWRSVVHVLLGVTTLALVDAVRPPKSGLRMGLLGILVLELDYVNPIDRPRKGWFWQSSLTPGL